MSLALKLCKFRFAILNLSPLPISRKKKECEFQNVVAKCAGIFFQIDFLIKINELCGKINELCGIVFPNGRRTQRSALRIRSSHANWRQ